MQNLQTAIAAINQEIYDKEDLILSVNKDIEALMELRERLKSFLPVAQTPSEPPPVIEMNKQPEIIEPVKIEPLDDLPF